MILRTSTHGIYIGKLNTFLRLVKTVLVSYLKTGHDSIHVIFFKFIRIYTCTFYNVIDYVTLSLFYPTDIFVCLMTCLLLVLDYKPFKRCKIIVARLLEQCENAYLSNYICYVGIVYDYIKYGSVLSTAIFLSATIRL